MYFVIVGMVLAIIFRSVLADTLLSKDIKTNVSALEVADVILAIIFMFVSNSFDWRVALIIICALFYRKKSAASCIYLNVLRRYGERLRKTSINKSCGRRISSSLCTSCCNLVHSWFLTFSS